MASSTLSDHDLAGMKHWRGGLACLSTDDMTKWEDHGVHISLEDITWATKEAWAPDCIERNGKYYFYFPARADRRSGGGIHRPARSRTRWASR